jgi:hypothetical protein
MELSVQEITKNRGVSLIAVLNIILYLSVFLVTVVIVPMTAHPIHGSGWWIVDMLAYAGFAYSVAGLVGSFLLFKYHKWIYALAMIGWIIETVFFSILSSVSYIYSYGWTQLLPYLSIVTIKVASIAYFTRKGVREAFGW